MRGSSVLLHLMGVAVLALAGCRDMPLQPTSPPAPITRSAPTAAIRSIAIVSGVTMVDLGPALRVNAINDSGYMVGQSANQLAAIWSPSGAMEEIRATCPPPCWPWPSPGCDPLASPGCATNSQHDLPSEATAINNKRYVVGYFRYDERYLSDFRGGFVWTPTAGFRDIWPHHDGTKPYAINDSGQMAGNAIFIPSYPPSCCAHAFRRSAAGVMTDLGTVGGANAWAKSINNHGDVVGVSPSPVGEGILWPATGGTVALGGLWALAIDSDARGINDGGVVVGQSYVGYPTGIVAFRWTHDDGMRQLAAVSSTANAINRDGYIVGGIAVAGSPWMHAALWTPDGSVIDLGTLGGYSEARAVNARLQVAGISIDAAGTTHAVRWDVTAVAPNQPPVADAGGPYAGNEGSPIAFSATASDPDGDALTLSWSFGDGTTATGASPTHTYADDGSYTVVLTATDPQGLTATSSTTATVANVAPTVHLDAPAPIRSGAAFSARATFTDPGLLDMPWRYTFDWGTGTPSVGSTLSQADAIVAQSPRYCAAGTYTVRASVRDKDGGEGTVTQTLSVARIDVPMNVLTGTLNPRSRGKLPVAVLGGPTFDARQLDVATVRLGSATNPGVPVARHPNGAYFASVEDANGDGLPDLLVHFERAALDSAGVLAAPSTELVLRAQMSDGCRQVQGSESVRVLAGAP